MQLRNVWYSGTMVVVALACATALQAQGESRYGTWLMDSDRPPPAVNVMTYESYGDGGMRITVESTNGQGQDSKWGYVTLFDGVFRAVEGQENAETAVEVVNERSTRILNKRGDRVSQVIINTLSEDGNSIENEYVRLDEEGKITGVGHATYRRIMRE
jgi:hypothetical protein